MTYYIKGTDDEIRGTLEKATTIYPITRKGNAWEYAGTGQTLDKESQQEMDSEGRPLFLSRSGQEVTFDEIEWRDD